jgi:hypothetical protein
VGVAPATHARGRPHDGEDASFVDALERLVALHREGHLDDAEFAAAKARLVGAAPQGVDA